MAFGYYYPITIAAGATTSAAGANLSSVPLPLFGTLAGLKSAGNGGNVQNSVAVGSYTRPADFAVYADAALTTPLKFQHLKWDPASGAFALVIKLPTYDNANGTTVYLAFGDAAVTTDQSDHANVYDANFVRAFDFGDGSTLDLSDATSNAGLLVQRGTANGVAAAGPVAGAVDFGTSADKYLREDVALVGAAPFTIEVVMQQNIATTATACVAGAFSSTAANQIQTVGTNTSRITAAGTTNVLLNSAANALTSFTSGWDYVAATHGSTTDHNNWTNGVKTTSSSASTSVASPTWLNVGAIYQGASGANFWKGKLAMLRISNVKRSDDWVEFTRKSYVAPFFTLGGLTPTTSDQTLLTAQPSATYSGAAVTVALTAEVRHNGARDTAYNGSYVATINGVGGTIVSGASGTFASGVANLSLAVVADGPGYTVTITPSGGTYPAIDSSAFTVVGAKTLANRSLADATTPSAWKAMWDCRLGLTVAAGKVSSWADAIGNYNGRTAYGALAQATGANQPSLVGTQGSGAEVVRLASASQQYLTSAANTSLNLFANVTAGQGAEYLVVIAKSRGASGSVNPMAGLAADPTSTAVYPFAAVCAGTSFAADEWGADYQVASTMTRAHPRAGTSCTDGVARVLAFGREARAAKNDGVGDILSTGSGQVTGTTNGSGDYIYRLLAGGRQPRVHAETPIATSGAMSVTVGRLGTAFADADILWVGLYFGELTKSVWASIAAFAQAQFGVQLDASCVNTLVVDGNSIPQGTGTTSPQTYLDGAGTTTWPYLVATATSGKGSWASRGMDVATSPHAYNASIGGRDDPEMRWWYPKHISAALDGSRGGRHVVLTFEIGNTLFHYEVNQTTFAGVGNKQGHTVGADASFNGDPAAGGNVTTARDDVLQYIKDKTDLIHADGGLHVVVTCADRNKFYTAPSSSNALSPLGTLVQAVNAELVAHPTSYCDYVIDLAADARFSVGNRACINTTFYNADRVHFTDTGEQAAADVIRAWFDANDGVLFPATNGGGDRRRRRYALQRRLALA